MDAPKGFHYWPRLIDARLEHYMRNFPAVLLRGPKWCGKSTSAANLAKSEIRLEPYSTSAEFKSLSTASLKECLRGERPRLIDEWQVAPRLWDIIRDEADTTGMIGAYVLTGSSSPKKGSTSHTGFLRIASLEMTSMSLFESRESSGTVSLSSLFEHPEKPVSGAGLLDEKGIDRAMVRGGFPGLVSRPGLDAALYLEDAVKEISEREIQKASGASLSPTTALALLRSLARNNCANVKNVTLLNDVLLSGIPFSEASLYRYYEALRSLYIIDEVRGFSPLARSRSSSRVLPKRLFFDPSLALAVLGRDGFYLERDRRTRGFCFENLVYRDLKAYSPLLSGISYYRDREGVEVDFVVSLRDGRYGCIEVKSSPDFIEEGAASLNAFRRKIARRVEKYGVSSKEFLPTFLAIVIDRGNAYSREDGIHVIPLSALAP